MRTSKVPKRPGLASGVHYPRQSFDRTGGSHMSRTTLLSLLVVVGLISTVGCATKGYVRNQVTPINNKIDELNDITAKNTQGIKDADSKADQGITAANAADQKAGAAASSADQANQGVARVGTGLNGLHRYCRESRQLQARCEYHPPVRRQQVHPDQGRPTDVG